MLPTYASCRNMMRSCYRGRPVQALDAMSDEELQTACRLAGWHLSDVPQHGKRKRSDSILAVNCGGSPEGCTVTQHHKRARFDSSPAEECLGSAQLGIRAENCKRKRSDSSPAEACMGGTQDCAPAQQCKRHCPDSVPPGGCVGHYQQLISAQPGVHMQVSSFVPAVRNTSGCGLPATVAAVLSCGCEYCGAHEWHEPLHPGRIRQYA